MLLDFILISAVFVFHVMIEQLVVVDGYPPVPATDNGLACIKDFICEC
jgi:hypothetical protein